MKVLVGEDDPEVGETVSMAFTMRWPECEVEIQETGGGGRSTPPPTAVLTCSSLT